MGKRFNQFWGHTTAALSAAEFWLRPGPVTRRRSAANMLRAQEQMLSSREIAENDRTRGVKWLTSRLSPDSEAEADLETIRNRCRDLYLNNPVAAGYVKDGVTKVIGTGFTYKSGIRDDAGLPAKRVKALNNQKETLFKQWAKKADITGRKSLWSRLRLAQRCFRRDGEAIVVLSDKPMPGKPIPLAIEVIAVNRLATPPELEGKKNVRLGIEKEEDGTPIAYYFRTKPPADTKEIEDKYQRVLADRVCHLYEEEEPGQSRGFPGMSPSAGLLKDINDLDHAEVVGKQVRASFTVFLPEVDPYRAATAASHDTNAAGKRLERIEPGLIYRYDPVAGEKPSFADPGGGDGGDAARYQELQHRKIAAGMEHPYESLLKTYGQANYSSARTVRLDGDEVTSVSQKRIDEELLSVIIERFTKEAVIAGLLDISPREYLDHPEVFDAYSMIPTGRPWVDPLKEAKADTEAVNEGFNSRTRVVRGKGHEDDVIQEERLRESMADADRELKLQEYRKSIGLDQEPEPPDDDKPDAGNSPPDKAKGN